MALPLNGLILLMVVVVAVFIAVRLRPRSTSRGRAAQPDPGNALRRAVRWGMGLFGVAVSVAAAAALGQRAIFLFAPLAISGYIGGLLLGELLMPLAPAGPVRRGSLDRRTTGVYINPGWVWAWRSAALAAAAAITAAGFAGAPDGRSLTLDCVGPMSNTAGPWPGWSYGSPALVALVLGALLVELSIRGAVRRPRPDPAVQDVAADDATRAASIRRAIATGIAVALIPLAGVALSAAMILSFVCSAPNQLAWTVPLAIVLAVVGIGAGIGAVAGLASLIVITDDADRGGPRGTGADEVRGWS